MRCPASRSCVRLMDWFFLLAWSPQTLFIAPPYPRFPTPRSLRGITPPMASIINELHGRVNREQRTKYEYPLNNWHYNGFTNGPRWGAVHKIRPLCERFYGRKWRNWNTSNKGSSTKYDHLMRVSMDENEKNEKLQLRDSPQNTTTLWRFLWMKMKKMKNFN